MKKTIGLFSLLASVFAFTMAQAATYYTVGGDGSGDTSFTSSESGLSYGGWSSNAGATTTEAHTVAAGNDYVIQAGDALRSRSSADATWDTFLGDSLMVAGTFNLKDNDNATRTVTVGNLIADGGTISVMKSNTAKLTLAGGLTIPEGKTITFDLDGGKYNGSSISKYPYLRVASTATGAGTVALDLFGEWNGGLNGGLPLVRFDFAGDWSGFTGDVVKGKDAPSTIVSPAKWSYVLMFTGSFGGRIASLSPRASGADPYYVVNHAANPKGIRAADFPNALRYRTVFYNVKSTDSNVRLFVYPTDKRPVFQLSYFDTDNAETALAKKVANQATAMDANDISYVDNGNGTETAVWNYDASTYADGDDDPDVIRIPTAAQNLVYTGSEQTGVAAGSGYALSGTYAATAAGDYQATATLTDAENTQWSDETTAAKTIDWSIAKATPVFSGTLTMAGWVEGATASEPSGLSSSFGTVVYAYYSDQACTTSIEKPTTAGTYYVRGEVAADTNWDAANSAAVSFMISAPPGVLALTGPITTEANPIELLTADQKTWLAMDKEVRRGLLSNKTDIQGIPSEWLTKDLALFSGGSPVTFAWEGTTAPCTVSLKRLSDNQTVWTKTGVTGTSLTVYNLEIGAGYEWTVTCGTATESAVFYTSAQAPRLLKAGEMRQVRDLGGWTGLQGCEIRQNVLIRGAAANDGNPPYESYVDDQALDFFVNELGIKHEIDLRKATETARKQSTAKIDPSGENIEYHNLNIIDYLPTDADLESSTVKAIFDLIFNAKNEPVYFHCAWGRDRTGTIAFLTEALLGVSKEDIWSEYQTSATTPTDARSSGTVFSSGETRYAGFSDLIDAIETKYPADTLAESAALYFQGDLGFTKAQIEQFRTDMLIGYETPEDPSETEIPIPTAAQGLIYNGQSQTGVAAGAGYTLSGTYAATAAGEYQATATLTDATNTKWSDNTTAAKTIDWSIAKATPVISGTLTMVGWTEGGAASEPSGLSSSFGTVVYAYYSDQACTTSIAKPTTAGTYYVRGEVAADTNWNAVSSAAVAFTVSAQGAAVTYYKVGEDTGSHTSFSKSDSTTSGWSLAQEGTIDASHDVAAANDYVVPIGTVLRTPSLDPDDTFAGKSLTLAGGSLKLKRATYATVGGKTVTIPPLTLTNGGTIENANDKTDFTLVGASITIPDGQTGVIDIGGGNRRGIIVRSALVGAGTLQLKWQQAGSAPSSQDSYLKLAGDNSGFTGTITENGDESVASTKYTLVLDGVFGGTITSLPKAKSNSIKVNYDNNAGLTVATTTIPAALKSDLVFYGSALFTAQDLPLITFPAGTTVDPTQFTVRHASSESGGATAFTGLDTIENGNGTITLVANHGSAPVAADATLNFGSTAKTIRPALHGCGVAPRTRALGKSTETQILKDAGFYSCRAHDLALHDGAQAIVDLQQIFPLFDKDPDDPRSYRFEPTDRVMSAITNAGMKIIFRLGSCGQSHGDDTHEYYNNIFTPSAASYDKIATVFSRIIAHYNEGWNNGYELGIEYWEVWNEPDADPGNRWPSSNAASEFPQLFAKVVKKVKTDHPSVKVGGPASFQLNIGFFDNCLNACNAEGACPDFYTFHYYSHYCGAARDPADLTAAVENMRSHLASRTCAGRACSEIEIGVTEWNYYSGPSTEWYGRLTMEGAAWCAGVAQDLQYSSADFSNWYGAGYNASFGIYNGRDGVLNKTYHCLKMVGRIVNGYTKLAARSDTDTLHVLGAVNDAGTKGCVMVTDRTASARNLTIGLSGFTGKTLSNIKCYVTDDSRDMVETATGFTLQSNAPNAVTLTKGATRSVWLITFDIAE